MPEYYKEHHVVCKDPDDIEIALIETAPIAETPTPFRALSGRNYQDVTKNYIINRHVPLVSRTSE